MVTPNPFTPQSGWEPRAFLGRDAQIAGFKKNIKDAIATKRSSHMIILGEWGIGKTSLLKQFKKIAQKEGQPASFCPISKVSGKETGSEIISLIVSEILKGFPIIKGFNEMAEEIEGVGISLAGFGGHIARKKTTPPPQIALTDALLRLWKHLETRLAIVLVDDIQNLGEMPEIIDILRLVLSREEIAVKTNYLFVLTSTAQGWNAFMDKHDPIGRFFRKRETIVSLSEAETKKVILQTLKNTGIKFSTEIVELAYNYTTGHPYELQVLCSNLYESQIKGLVLKRQWPIAFKNTLSELGKDYFDSLCRKVSDREEPVLRILCQFDADSDTRSIQEAVRKSEKSYPVNDVRLYAHRLIDKGLVKSGKRGCFRIADNMLKEYLRSTLLQNGI